MTVPHCWYLQVVFLLSSLPLPVMSLQNIVVVGAGIQGTSVAYHLAQKTPPSTKITILESQKPASAASGKGGGFSEC